MPSVWIPVASGQRPTDTAALQPIYQFLYLSWLQLIKCEHLNIHHGFSVTTSPPVKFSLPFLFLHEGKPAPWLNQEDCLLRKSYRGLSGMVSGWSRLDNNCRFMSKLVVNSSTGYPPPLIKQAYFAGLCFECWLLRFPLLGRASKATQHGRTRSHLSAL